MSSNNDYNLLFIILNQLPCVSTERSAPVTLKFWQLVLPNTESIISFATHTCGIGIRPLPVKFASPVLSGLLCSWYKPCRLFPWLVLGYWQFSFYSLIPWRILLDSTTNSLMSLLDSIMSANLSRNQQRWLQYFVLSSMPRMFLPFSTCMQTLIT